MRRAAALAVLAVLAAAPSASAALVETPFQPLTGGQVATCLRAPGAAGELTLWRPHGADVLVAGNSGAVRSERVPLGRLSVCPALASAPGGAAVAAAWRSGGLRVAVREPGAAFGPVARLSSRRTTSASEAVAVTPAGHAIVAWIEKRGKPTDRSGRLRVFVARRAPGGAFGSPEALTPWRVSGTWGEPHVVAGLDAAGRATVAWAHPRERFGAAAVEVATAAPGASFAVQRLAARSLGASRLAVSIAPDGWALLAHDGWSEPSAYERAPGADRFTRVPGIAEGSADGAVTVAVRDGGGGVVAWRGDSNRSTASVHAMARETGGPFGEVQTLAPDRSPTSSFGVGLGVAFAGGPPFDEGNADLKAALAPDGRVMLAWTAERAGLGSALVPRVADGTLGTGFGAVGDLGSRVRDVNGLAPLFLPDGRSALAWTDNAGQFGASVPTGHGRLHLAVDGGVAVESPPPPRVTLRAPRVQRLYRFGALRASVSCDRACDVRIAAGGFAASQVITLRANRTRAVKLQPLYDVLRPGERRIRARVSAAGGTRMARASTSVRVIRRPRLPVPEPLDVRAQRDGDGITVSWRTATPAQRVVFLVQAGRNRGFSLYAGTRGSWRLVRGRGRTEFTVRLRPRRRVRWVSVRPESIDGGRSPGAVVVPVS